MRDLDAKMYGVWRGEWKTGHAEVVMLRNEGGSKVSIKAALSYWRTKGKEISTAK